jgi:nicotinamide mononucleotide transporter
MNSLSNAIDWLQTHYLEIIAVTTGLLYILFTIRGKILLWLFGIISSAIYVWIFYKSKIYAYSLLYIYYVIIGFYGWYNWAGKKEGSGDNSLLIRHTPVKWLAGCIVSTVLIAVPVYFILIRFTDSDMALLDAVLTSGGMVATWMLTQKFVEQWLFWIILNALSLSAMLYKSLYPSAVLFLVYDVLAVKGYFDWKKEIQTRSK